MPVSHLQRSFALFEISRRSLRCPTHVLGNHCCSVSAVAKPSPPGIYKPMPAVTEHSNNAVKKDTEFDSQ